MFMRVLWIKMRELVSFTCRPHNGMGPDFGGQKRTEAPATTILNWLQTCLPHTGSLCNINLRNVSFWLRMCNQHLNLSKYYPKEKCCQWTSKKYKKYITNRRGESYMLEITISQNKKKIFMLEICNQSLLCDQFTHQNTEFYENMCSLGISKCVICYS